jgi:hypothetical protein
MPEAPRDRDRHLWDASPMWINFFDSDGNLLFETCRDYLDRAHALAVGSFGGLECLAHTLQMKRCMFELKIDAWIAAFKPSLQSGMVI